jgi:hypothetical protein
MSGGAFDYWQYHISQIADQIEGYIVNNNDLSLDEWGTPRGREYSPETVKRFKEGLFALRLAFIYAQRIDWLISGDDGENTFHQRLNRELDEIFSEYVEQAKALRSPK